MLMLRLWMCAMLMLPQVPCARVHRTRVCVYIEYVILNDISFWTYRTGYVWKCTASNECEDIEVEQENGGRITTNFAFFFATSVFHFLMMPFADLLCATERLLIHSQKKS